MQQKFDFDRLKQLFTRKDFKFHFDAMNGIAGPYAKKIFGDILLGGGAQKSGFSGEQNNIRNCVPKEDFGGLHPDPNLTYAKELVEVMDPLKQ